eukprot:3169059-Pyramimonas_sp.AAC.1
MQDKYRVKDDRKYKLILLLRTYIHVMHKFSPQPCMNISGERQVLKELLHMVGVQSRLFRGQSRISCLRCWMLCFPGRPLKAPKPSVQVTMYEKKMDKSFQIRNSVFPEGVMGKYYEEVGEYPPDFV